MDTLSKGGSEHTVPTHARVMTLGVSFSPATLSSTTGVGKSAEDALRSIFTVASFLVPRILPHCDDATPLAWRPRRP